MLIKQIFPMLIIFLVTLTGNSSSYADANTITLNFSGKIKAGTCNVSSGDGQKVSLGDIGTTNFGSAGDLSSAQPFAIGLNCPTGGPDQATVTFNGTAASDPNLLALDSSGGAASGVAIRISQQSDGSQVKLNTPSATTALIAGENTLKFTAQYEALTDRRNITPGTANATAQFTINYP
jgi:type 1 fimbria pilin